MRRPEMRCWCSTVSLTAASCRPRPWPLGNGTGTGLGNQGGLVLTRNERWLLAVNSGSNSLSVFEVQPQGLRLTDIEPTAGVQPVSVTENRGIVYVVHAGSDNIAGFTLGTDGSLHALDGSIRPLSGRGVGPAEIAFTPDGSFLLVTEKNTNSIVTFAIDRDGLPASTHVQAASGVTPFGFSFGKRDRVFVTEAFGGAPNASATSSYEIGRDGMLTAAQRFCGRGWQIRYPVRNLWFNQSVLAMLAPWNVEAHAI
jgi:6-phosphogluconolactonase